MPDLPQLFQELLEKSRVKHVPKGQIILYEGDLPQEIFIIKTGIVKLYNIDDDGNEKVLHLLKTPALIPLAFFSGEDTPTRWYYTALVDCDLYSVARQDLVKLMHDDSEVAICLMNWFSNEVHEFLVRMDSLSKSRVGDKLTAVLRYLVVCHGVKRRSGWARIPFPVNHQLLADMIGVTRESTAVAMKELADEKFIRNPRLTILEINTNKLLGQPAAN